jgi:hypothetical protein
MIIATMNAAAKRGGSIPLSLHLHGAVEDDGIAMMFGWNA